MTAPAGRLARLRARLRELELPGLLVSGAANVRYLSGFAGEGFLVVSGEGAWLVTDGRYEEEAAAGAGDGWTVVSYRREGELKERLQALAAGAGWRRLGFEAAHTTVARRRWLEEALPGVELDPREGLVEELRRVKDPDELARIGRALALAEEAFRELLAGVRPGRTERDLALELEFTLRRRGAEVSFPPIVASGPRTSLPHARPGERRLEAGDLLLVDFGARWEGYCSDTTRMVTVGPADPRQREVHAAVVAAHAAARAAIRPGVTGGEVDAAARAVLREAGLEERFLHGTGHGVGLEIHEAPRLSPDREDRLEEGMVVTVEPGVYLPGWGGVRVEDLVLVTAEGGRSLNTLPQELLAV